MFVIVARFVYDCNVRVWLSLLVIGVIDGCCVCLYIVCVMLFVLFVMCAIDDCSFVIDLPMVVRLFCCLMSVVVICVLYVGSLCSCVFRCLVVDVLHCVVLGVIYVCYCWCWLTGAPCCC